MGLNLSFVLKDDNKVERTFASIEAAEAFLNESDDIKKVQVTVTGVREKGSNFTIKAAYDPSTKALSVFLSELYQEIERRRGSIAEGKLEKTEGLFKA